MSVTVSGERFNAHGRTIEGVSITANRGRASGKLVGDVYIFINGLKNSKAFKLSASSMEQLATAVLEGDFHSQQEPLDQDAALRFAANILRTASAGNSSEEATHLLHAARYLDSILDADNSRK